MYELKIFPLDLRAWGAKEDLLQRVMDRLEQENKPGILADKSRWSMIFVELYSRPTNRNEKGAWVSLRQTLRIVTPKERELGPQVEAYYKKIIDHELRHFAQGILAFAAGYDRDDPQDRKPSPGFPSRHIMTPDAWQTREDTPDFLVDKLREEFPEIPRDRLKKMRHEVLLHALDDIEFHPRMGDAILKFQRKLTEAEAEFGKLPPATVNEAIRVFSDSKQAEDSGPLSAGRMTTLFRPDDLFFITRRYAPKKWRRAVGELIKAVL
jgi:hypothetical protein